MDINSDLPVLGYLSAAPRVSTQPHAEASGPRAHVLNVIRGFGNLGWDVKPFIVGDRLPSKWSGRGSGNRIGGSLISTLAADVLRLSMGSINARRAWKELGDQVDWVYERFAVLQSLGYVFKRQGIPWILETNALYFKEAAEERKSIVLTNIARKREIHAYRSCDVLICVSQGLKNLIEHETGIFGEKMIVVPNGVDIDFFDPEKHSQPHSCDQIVIGFVGHLYPWQGLDILFHAVKEVKEKDNLSYQIDIVGDGPQRTQLEQLAADLGLSSDVRFLGRVPWEEVPGYIAKFDIGYSNKVLRHSNAQYFSPIKMYEYMSMAKPVLCSNGQSDDNVIQHQRTGFLFASENIENLKNVLREVDAARDRLPILGEMARQEAILYHSWNTRISNMCDEIEGILNQHKTVTNL